MQQQQPAQAPQSPRMPAARASDRDCRLGGEGFHVESGRVLRASQGNVNGTDKEKAKEKASVECQYVQPTKDRSMEPLSWTRGLVGIKVGQVGQVGYRVVNAM